MSTASKILEDQTIHVKRGRLNSFGYEPAWNSYFDFYISSKYIDPPLLKLEDIGFHLFLRKNLNDRNPQWKMPTIQQMMKRLVVSYSRLSAMMERLEKAHLLVKESGFRKGPEGKNVRNDYILSDPIQTLEEFLEVASAGIFANPLRSEWREKQEQYRDFRDTPIADTAIPPTAEIAVYKQTSFFKQTDDTEENKLWHSILSQLKTQTPSATFQSFIADTYLVGMDGAVATIGTPRTFAKDWLENRLSNHLRKIMNLELRMREGANAQQIEAIQFVFAAGAETSGEAH